MSDRVRRRDGGAVLSSIAHFAPVDCVLCDNTAASPAAHNEHMQEVHDL